MNKKSRVALILNNIFSAIGFVCFGYISYILWVFGSLALNSGNGDNAGLLFTLFIIALPPILCLANFVLSCVSYKYLGRGINRYNKKVMLAVIIMEILLTLSFIANLVLMNAEFLFILINSVFIIVFVIIIALHMVDYKSSAKTLKQDLMDNKENQ